MILIIFITAIHQFVLFGYSLAVIAAMFLILCTTSLIGIKAALPLSVLTALALRLCGLMPISAIAVYAFATLLACCVRKINKLLTVFIFIAGALILTAYTEGITNVFLYAKEMVAGAILFIALPLSRLPQPANRQALSYARDNEALTIYIREQLDKQRAAQSAFFITKPATKTTTEVRNKTTLYAVINDVCTSCGYYDFCWNDSPKETMALFYSALESFNGSDFVFANSAFIKMCHKPECVKLVVNHAFKNALRESAREARFERQQEYYLTKQQSLIELSEEIFDIMQSAIVKHQEEENSLLAALTRESIAVRGVFIFSDRRNIMHLYISLNENSISRKLKRSLIDCIRISVGIKADFDNEYAQEEGKVLSFVEAPLMRMSVSQKKMLKKHSDVSGDSSTVADVDKGLVLAAIADGMGSGADAQRYSGQLLDIIEDLLGCGIDIKKAVMMANGILEFEDGVDIFSTLDALLFNEYTSEAVFIKAGACATYIKTDDKIEKIEFDTTPIGILDMPNVKITQKTLRPNTYIYMFSDGFSSYLTDRQIREILRNTKSRSPQNAAEAIFTQFDKLTEHRQADDITVMVAKVWQRAE